MQFFYSGIVERTGSVVRSRRPLTESPAGCWFALTQQTQRPPELASEQWLKLPLWVSRVICLRSIDSSYKGGVSFHTTKFFIRRRISQVFLKSNNTNPIKKWNQGIIIGYNVMMTLIAWPLLAGCRSNPCQNGGSCTDRTTGPSCRCPRGFAGDFCELLGMCLVYTYGRYQQSQYLGRYDIRSWQSFKSMFDVISILFHRRWPNVDYQWIIPMIFPLFDVHGIRKWLRDLVSFQPKTTRSKQCTLFLFFCYTPSFLWICKSKK